MYRATKMATIAAIIALPLVSCTSVTQPSAIGVGGIWNTQDHQAIGGNGGSTGNVGGRGPAGNGRGAASGGMGHGRG